jgi:glycosyltransferase involved in cell wall biosynthesis
MATGRAIVASDLGPRSETISDGATGLLFEAGNSEDLRRKVLQLIGNPGLCQQLGTAARRAFLEAYTPGKNYTMLMDIYRSVSKST